MALGQLHNLNLAKELLDLSSLSTSVGDLPLRSVFSGQAASLVSTSNSFMHSFSRSLMLKYMQKNINNILTSCYKVQNSLLQLPVAILQILTESYLKITYLSFFSRRRRFSSKVERPLFSSLLSAIASLLLFKEVGMHSEPKVFLLLVNGICYWLAKSTVEFVICQ